jgi:hypothetical protein
MSILKSIVAVWSSRKLWMTLIACGIVWVGFERTVDHLYVMPSETHVTGLVTLAVSVFGIIGVLVAAYMGTNALQAKFGLSGVAQIVGQSAVEKSEHKETVDQRIVNEYAEKHGSDPSYRPLDTLPDTGVETFR